MTEAMHLFGGLHWKILNDQREPVEADFETWARWHREQEEKELRGEPNLFRIARADLPGVGWVSTVFLSFEAGIRHPSQLFETMAFAEDDGRTLGQWRYGTWAQAEAGHKLVVEMLKQASP